MIEFSESVNMKKRSYFSSYPSLLPCSIFSRFSNSTWFHPSSLYELVVKRGPKYSGVVTYLTSGKALPPVRLPIYSTANHRRRAASPATSHWNLVIIACLPPLEGVNFHPDPKLPESGKARAAPGSNVSNTASRPLLTLTLRTVSYSTLHSSSDLLREGVGVLA